MRRFCLFPCGLCVVSGIALAQRKSNVQYTLVSFLASNGGSRLNSKFKIGPTS